MHRNHMQPLYCNGIAPAWPYVCRPSIPAYIVHPHHPIIIHHVPSLLSNTPVTELRPAGIMNSIRHNLLHLLRQSFLQRLGYLGVARRVRDFAGLRVGARVVQGVGDLVLGVGGDLSGRGRLECGVDWKGRNEAE